MELAPLQEAHFDLFYLAVNKQITNKTLFLKQN